jgi:hypothetical protein
MKDINRRSTLTLGLATAAIPLLIFPRFAGAAIPVYGPKDGSVLSPGVRWVDIGEVESQIAAYKKVMFGDAIYEPGAADPVDQALMDKDMFCFILQSDFKVQKAGIAAYIVKQGECYTCGKGKSDQGTNIGSGIGIMRVAMFEPA